MSQSISDQSEREDLQRIALAAVVIVAEYENELIKFPAGEPRQDSSGCKPDSQGGGRHTLSAEPYHDACTGDDPAGVMVIDDAVAAAMPSSTVISPYVGSTPAY